MTNIYNQHDAAFANVSAYVILGNDADEYGNRQRVATIAFKHPRDGASRLYAYVHWIGLEMVRGHANGYGYDKKSAACESAIEKLLKLYEGDKREVCYSRISFIKALQNIGGSTWDRRLQDAGFTVLQAV